jgi:hypothetical protein
MTFLPPFRKQSPLKKLPEKLDDSRIQTGDVEHQLCNPLPLCHLLVCDLIVIEVPYIATSIEIQNRNICKLEKCAHLGAAERVWVLNPSCENTTHVAYHCCRSIVVHQFGIYSFILIYYHFFCNMSAPWVGTTTWANKVPPRGNVRRRWRTHRRFIFSIWFTTKICN